MKFSEIKSQWVAGTDITTLANRAGLTFVQTAIVVGHRGGATDYQTRCIDTAVYPSVGHNITYPLMAMVGEAGEMANKFKKVLRGDKKLNAELREKLAGELGDVLYYVAVLAFELGVSLDEVMRMNTDKLQDRKQRGVLKGDGDNR